MGKNMIIEVRQNGDVYDITKIKENKLEFGVKYIIKDHNVIITKMGDGYIVSRYKGGSILYRNHISGLGKFKIGEMEVEEYSENFPGSKPVFNLVTNAFGNLVSFKEDTTGSSYRVVLDVWVERGIFQHGYTITVNPKLFKKKHSEDIIGLIAKVEKMDLSRLYYYQGSSSYKINKRSVSDMEAIASLNKQMIG